MSPYEDAERLNTEIEHLRELLQQTQKTITHQYDVIRELKLELLSYKEAVEEHDDQEEECYRIADRMALRRENDKIADRRST